jgi:hypothetical protein
VAGAQPGDAAKPGRRDYKAVRDANRSKVAARAGDAAANGKTSTSSASASSAPAAAPGATAADPKAGGQPAGNSSEPSKTPGATSPPADDLLDRLTKLATDDKRVKDGEKALGAEREKLGKDRQAFETERTAWGEKSSRAAGALALLDKGDKIGAIRAFLGSDYEGDLLLDLSKVISGESTALTAADVDKRVAAQLEADEKKRTKAAEEKAVQEKKEAVEKYTASLDNYMLRTQRDWEAADHATRWPAVERGAKLFSRSAVEAKYHELVKSTGKDATPVEVMDAIYADFYPPEPAKAEPPAKPAPTVAGTFRQGAPPEVPTPTSEEPRKRETYAEVTARRRAQIADREKARRAS